MPEPDWRQKLGATPGRENNTVLRKPWSRDQLRLLWSFVGGDFEKFLALLWYVDGMEDSPNNADPSLRSRTSPEDETKSPQAETDLKE